MNNLKENLMRKNYISALKMNKYFSKTMLYFINAVYYQVIIAEDMCCRVGIGK